MLSFRVSRDVTLVSSRTAIEDAGIALGKRGTLIRHLKQHDIPLSGGPALLDLKPCGRIIGVKAPNGSLLEFLRLIEH